LGQAGRGRGQGAAHSAHDPQMGKLLHTRAVTFNAELLGESAELRKHVIVHELLHLKVPNHGKVLRALLRAYLSGGEMAGSLKRMR
jgi:predicted metal-dependent hydrolase